MSEESRYMFEVATIEVDEPKSWYFDSWASKHVIGNKSSLKKLKQFVDSIRVKIPKGHTYVVQGKGDVNLSSTFGIKKIIDVLYVLGVTKNLLSVGMIVDKGYPIMFDVQQCILTKTIQLNKVITKG
jgi:hypothetical protein